jgi:MFS transporter, DHA1 family, tetracycline resistance protein
MLDQARMSDADPFSTKAAPGTAKDPMPAAIKFVLATILINAMGFGIVIPVFPKLIMQLGDASIDRATAIGGHLGFTFALFQFVCSPIVGNLSDRFGRRPVLLGSLAGFAFDFLVLAFAPTLGWLFIARALTGMFGATNGPAQSVIADITPVEGRSRWFGYIGAAFGIGFVIGPAIGGFLAELGVRVPFYAAAALASANFIYGWFMLPETLKPENRRAFDWRRANPVGSLLQVRKLPGILPISTVYFLWQLSSLIYPMIWSYFAIGRFGWSGAMVGLSLAIMGIAMALMQIFVAAKIVARVGERRTATIGLTGAVACMTALAFISTGWLAFLLMPLIAVGSLTQPCLTAMMTRRADATNQGEVQGFASGVMAVGSIIAPLLYNPVQAWFTGPDAPFEFHGAAFAIAAGIAVLALTLLLRIAPAATPDPATLRAQS